jgi:hypothetical protein
MQSSIRNSIALSTRLLTRDEQRLEHQEREQHADRELVPSTA